MGRFGYLKDADRGQTSASGGSTRVGAVGDPAPAGAASSEAAAAATLPRYGRAHAIIAIGVIALGAFLLSMGVFEDYIPPSDRPPGRQFLVEILFGPRWGTIIIGAGALALGAAIAVHEARRASRRGRFWIFFAGMIALLGAAAPSAVSAAGRALERSARRAAAAELLPRHGALTTAAEFTPGPALRERVVVWDCEASRTDGAEGRLPEPRRGSIRRGPVSLILIIGHADKREESYPDGTAGFRRTLTFAVVDWPERTVVGAYRVTGSFPPRKKSDPAKQLGPIVGDTESDLMMWIQNCPRK